MIFAFPLAFLQGPSQVIRLFSGILEGKSKFRSVGLGMFVFFWFFNEEFHFMNVFLWAMKVFG